MSTASNIEWTDATWNPVRGCRKVSPGCKNCYAETMAKRLRAMGQAGYLRVVDDRGRWTGEFETDPARLAEPLGWKKPRRVFVNSMSDLFGEGVPFEFIAAVFGVMAATPRHTYQVLTKRPAQMVEFFAWLDRLQERTRNVFPEDEPGWRRRQLLHAQALRHSVDPYRGGVSSGAMGEAWPLPNVWLGVSTEDQATADERIPLLLQVPAAVRFISAEPMLGMIDLEAIQIPGEREGLRFSALRRHHDDRFGASDTILDWIIAGGESGPGARDCRTSWLGSIVEQCKAADVPVFVKQLGSRPVWSRRVGFGVGEDPRCAAWGGLKDPKGGDPAEWPEDLRVRQWPREVARG